METIKLKRDCEVIAIPSGERQLLPQGTSVCVVQACGDSYTVSLPTRALYRIDGKDADALGLDAQTQVNGPEQQGPLNEEMVWNALRKVYDPELPVNIVDLGLVYSCIITPYESGSNTVAVRMGVTAPGCGMSNVLKNDVERKIKQLPDVKEARIEVVLDPAWNPSRMSEAARLQLGFDVGDNIQTKLVRLT